MTDARGEFEGKVVLVTGASSEPNCMSGSA